MLEDTEAIAYLRQAEDEQPRPEKKSILHPLAFPPQEYKLSAGDNVEDPFRGAKAGEIVHVDGQGHTLRLKRGPSLAAVPVPSAIVASAPIGNSPQREAIARLSDAVLANTPGYRAVRLLLTRDLPRVHGRPSGLRWITFRPQVDHMVGRRMTSRLCSMTSTVFPDRPVASTSSSFATSSKCRPVVGSSRM